MHFKLQYQSGAGLLTGNAEGLHDGRVLKEWRKTPAFNQG